MHNRPTAPLPYPFDRPWPISSAAALATLMECSAPKAGNVHPNAEFQDMSIQHFLASGVAIQPHFLALSHNKSSSVGHLVLDCVRAVREQVPCNTILGTLLLLAPLGLAAQHNSHDLQTSVAEVLQQLTPRDSELVYQAIREANPGGLGQRDIADINTDAPKCLVSAMREVAEWDAVARQYTNNFSCVFEHIAPWLEQALGQTEPMDAICRVQLRQLANEKDGLIIRKLGHSAAEEVRLRAEAVYSEFKERCEQESELSWRLCETLEYRQLDDFLRSENNGRNPGTTADLIAAGLFVLLVRRADLVEP